MLYAIKTEDFSIEYIESEILNTALWENHCHAQFEMIAVLEGDVEVKIEGRSYRLQKNQSIIIPPLCYHCININQRGIYRRVTVLFDVSAIPPVLHDSYKKYSSDIHVTFSPHIEKLKEICQKKQSAFYAPLVQSLMIQSLYDSLKETKDRITVQPDSFLQKVILYIDNHLNEMIVLEDLAKLTSRSKSSFCHLFEEKMNISPKQYILQKKLALASKLIAEGTPPTVAAMHVGYENYSNFYRLYRKHFGKSPTKNN